jgi:DNA-binding LacI/PurR family transcriptional regulator
MSHELRAQRLTLKRLAAELGVSRTTVSNAFSRPDQLSADLRERILAAAREAGYSGPDPVARMLRTGRAGAIGLILPWPLPSSLDDPTTTALIRGIADACEERRLGLLIIPGVVRGRESHRIIDVAVDGFIAYSLPRDLPVLDEIVVRGDPLVIVDQPRRPDVATIHVDDFLGAQMAAAHLVDLGHRHFAIVALPFQADGYTGPGRAERMSSSSYDVPTERLRGYRDALAARGIELDHVPVFECAYSDEAIGLQAGRFLLEATSAVTAVLAMSDRLALGVYAAARERRVSVPGQLSIVGFDDIDGASRARPSLTTIRQPIQLKGYAAARLLLDSPQGRRRGPTAGGLVDEPYSVDLDIELVVRRSTGAPPVVASPG